MTKKQKKALKRILIAAALMVVLAVLPLPGAANALLYLVPYWVVGGDILRKAVLGVKNRQLLGLTQSAVSHQLRVLKTSKLVRNRREGKTVFYALDDDHVRRMLEMGMEHLSE